MLVGEVFLRLNVEGHTGPETVQDRLNDPDLFLTVSVPGETPLVFLNKIQVIRVEVSEGEEPRRDAPDSLVGVSIEPIRVQLINGEQRQPRALACLTVPADRERALAVLRREGYATQIATDPADALERLRFTAYALVIVGDGFGTAAGDGNPVLDHLAQMGMVARRLMHVVFVSAGVRSHDTAAAFARSVDLALHVNDLPHLAEALKRSQAEAEQVHRVLLESLRALGKG
jgi:CheY-like chemotaxis protein